MRGPLSIPCLGPALALNAREPIGRPSRRETPRSDLAVFGGGAPPPFRERRAHPPPSLGQVASWQALAAGSAVRPPFASSARSVQRPIFPERHRNRRHAGRLPCGRGAGYARLDQPNGFIAVGVPDTCEDAGSTGTMEACPATPPSRSASPARPSSASPPCASSAT